MKKPQRTDLMAVYTQLGYVRCNNWSAQSDTRRVYQSDVKYRNGRDERHNIEHLDELLMPRSRYLVADDAPHGSTWQLTPYFHVSHRASRCVTGVRLPGRSSLFAVSKERLRHFGDEDTVFIYRRHHRRLRRSTDRRTADQMRHAGRQERRLFWHRHG